MSRKILVGGEEKGDWFDAVLSWASPAKPKPPAPKPPAPKKAVKRAVEQPVAPSVPPEPPPTPVVEPVVEDVEPPPRKPKRTLEVLHPCGHFNWASPEQDEAARAEDKCCGNWRSLPKWEVRGLYVPVPERQRRSFEREQVTWGWPGLCCDPKTGFYIGGIGNDCRYYHKGPERCVVHAEGPRKAKPTAPATTETPEPPEEEGGDVSGAVEEPPRVKSPARKRKA